MKITLEIITYESSFLSTSVKAPIETKQKIKRTLSQRLFKLVKDISLTL